MKLAELQQKIKVAKGEVNKFGNYRYRTAEQILTEAKRIANGEAVILLSESIELIGDRYYVKATAKFIGEDTHEVSSFAREALSKKGNDEAQITGAATSYARKYALGGLLMIDDGNDPDHNDNNDTPEKPTNSHVEKTIEQLREEAIEILNQQGEDDDRYNRGIAYIKNANKTQLVSLINILNGKKSVAQQAKERI